MRPVSLALACLLLAAILTQIPSHSNSPSSMGQAAETTLSANPRLGIAHISAINEQTITSSPQRYQAAKEAGAGWNRWVFYWHEIETSPGVYNWGPQDTLTTSDLGNGLSTEVVLLGTPSLWSGAQAQSTRNELPFPRVGPSARLSHQVSGQVAGEVNPSAATSPPAGLDQPIFTTSNGSSSDNPAGATGINPSNPWARFVHTAVSRFKGSVRVWEMWNEPDYPTPNGFWSGSAEQYYRLLKVGYLAAKFADPTCTVLMGGMAFWFDQYFVTRALQAAKADLTAAAHGYYFDATAWHWYGRSWDLRDMVNYTRNNILAPQGFASKPYWVNESGSPLSTDPDPSVCPGHPGCRNGPYLTSSNLTEQASYVIQSIAYAFASGVDKLLTFQFADDGNAELFGIVRNTGTPRPSYYAYKLANTHFRDIIRSSLTTQGNADIVTFYTSARQRVLAMWNKGAAAMTVYVPAQATSALLYPQPNESALDPSPLAVYPLGGQYSIVLPGATCRLSAQDPYTIGGFTYLLVESGVDAFRRVWLPVARR